MGKMLNPATYRIRADQEAWLKICAEKQGHYSKSVVLRLVIDRAMRATARRQKAVA